MNILQINSHFSEKGSRFSMDIEAAGYPDGAARVPIEEITYNSLVLLFKSEPQCVAIPETSSSDLIQRLLNQGREEVKRVEAKKEADRVLTPFEKVGFSSVADVAYFSADMAVEEEDPGEQYRAPGDSDVEAEQF